MGRFVGCDSCGKSAPDVSTNRLLSPHGLDQPEEPNTNMGMGQQAPVPGHMSIGGDGWLTLNLTHFAQIHASDYPRLVNRAWLDSDPYYVYLTSTIDLCPECAVRVIKATGCEDRISRDPPAPPTPAVSLFDEEKTPVTRDKTSWDHLREEDHSEGNQSHLPAETPNQSLLRR